MVTPRTDNKAAFPYKFIDGLTRVQQEQIYEDLLYLSRAGGGTRWRTLVIAASDSNAVGKSTADYVCSGVADQTIINTAIAALESRIGTTGVGRLVLLEGTYNITAQITVTSLGARTLAIEGMGAGVAQALGTTISATRIVSSAGADFGIRPGGNSASAGSSLIIENLSIESASSQAAIGCQDMALVVRNCNVKNTGTGGGIIITHSTGSEGSTRIENNVIVSSGTGGTGIYVDNGPAPSTTMTRVSGNIVTVAGSGAVGIRGLNNSGQQSGYSITGNMVIGNTTGGSGYGIRLDGNSQYNNMIANNVVYNHAIGIAAASTNVPATGLVIANNLISTVSIGIQDIPFGLDYVHIIGNNITICASKGISLGEATETTTATVVANKISNSSGATGIVIGAFANNTGVFYNDTYGCASDVTDSGVATRREGSFLTAASLPNHHTTHETGGADAITGSVDGNARVGVRKNTGVTTYRRRRINLIEGANVALTVSDDSVDEEVDVTIAVSGISGSTTFKNNGTSVGAEATLNVIPGSGITIGMVDTGTQIDLTITAAGAAATASAEFNHFMHS